MVKSFQRRGVTRRALLAGGVAAVALPRGLRAEPAGPRVVALEWNSTETLLLLGLAPVGVAERDGFRAWVDVEADRLAGVPDLGRRQQPSLEAIERLRPDLILASAYRHRSIEARLAAIAPTELVADNPADLDMFAALVTATRQIGARVGRYEAAARQIADFDTRLVAMAERYGPSAAGRSLIVAQPLPGIPRLRVFTSNSALMRSLERVGFSTPGFGPPQPFGFTTLGLETLAALPAETRLVILGEAFPEALTASPLWPLLPVVASGHVKVSGGKPWPFGALASLSRAVEGAAGAAASLKDG